MNGFSIVLLGVQEGKASVICASSEVVVEGGQWALTAMKKYRQRMSLLALDEVHCLSE